MNNFLQVAVGGAVGATARYGVTILAGRLTTLPLGTLAVNVTGCFAMGLLAAGLAFRGGQHLAPLLLTGVLGGYTTFSAFSLDTLTLWERGAAALALGYVAASVLLSLMAVTAGLALGRGIFA
ncbi:fluoride efflux transporter CrcB [Paracoccus yeei]|jgi:CrcB protein|uniref:Fluoride-specific ion channel FluC n=2 Tax=Paracoccus TaxID=265 RepID=A0A1V0GR86_9RHOB|nr:MULTISPECIES: fluoride efflux transporter CrcB [Paracoccus]ARC36310.1 fluoride efflux transporter CrcB [Paracoccus yeei]ATQ54880.1 fluoride efflux transporter CrcB [Paracoccus yeei]AWX92868.1 fluoride efflux transporter CrcB [Paracoccus mutanolyticus]AYF02293.1 fluoride efflux transporter CrcB [Paracoccus yeei]MBY0135638.1 fluoride efflux transporter CrcB [Paracoccus yeei]